MTCSSAPSLATLIQGDVIAQTQCAVQYYVTIIAWNP
jgi:hypothetical protein